MGRHQKHTRDILLQMAVNKPDEILEFKAYLKWNKESDWCTFSTVKLVGSDLLVSKHINLPKHKLAKHLELNETDNHKAFVITGSPSYYDSKGTKRGSIQLLGIRKLNA